MNNQKITEKIIDSLRAKIILNILKEYEKERKIIKIFLCDIDRFQELKENKNILNELVKKQAIKKYQIIQKMKKDVMKVAKLTPPTPLQKEIDPTIVHDYQEELKKQCEDEGCYQLDAPCNVLKLNKNDINIKKLKNLIKNNKEIKKFEKNEIIVKNIKLDKINYILKINKDEKFISFKSKKKERGVGRETKLFQIFYHLWDLRWEYKKGILSKEGDWAAKSNLQIQGKTTESGLDAQLKRLRKKLKELPVFIEPNNAGKYRLIVKLQ